MHVRLKGLVWGHRRATEPMKALTSAFSAVRPDITLDWQVRSLADFEHQALSDVASACDIVLLDHPFAAEIVASGAFLPLSGLGLGCDLTDAASFIGASLASYRFGGSVWAVPVDGACQHAAYRPDLMSGHALPLGWDDVLTLGAALRREGRWLGLAALTPHAGLVLAALMANLGRPWQTDPDLAFAVDRGGFAEAYDLLTQLIAFCPPEVTDWNAIHLHDAMTTRDDIVYCPCVFGYATYAEPGPRRLAFADFPGPRAPHPAGAVLGGAGLAVSRRTAAPEAALACAAFCAEAATQSLIAFHHGQPARIEAWSAAEADRRLGGYLSAVRKTIDAAWVRPRTRGYIPFQAHFGRLIAEALRTRRPVRGLWADVEALLGTVNP